jgi:uncharacterized membrane protein
MSGQTYLPGSARLAHLWESLRTSFWFVPTLMIAGTVGLSFLSVHVDGRLKVQWVRTVGWIWAGSPEGARQMLSTIAGSMITVAGVAFSITIVALTLASTQFGPRLLRSFVRDLGNQVVLGTFVSTFVYCLLVLRTVRGGDGAEFVPYLSVTLGVAFALTSLGVLIYFIHHVASAIQAEHLIASVARELEESIEQMFPEELGRPGEPEADEEAPAEGAGEAALVEADRSGYVEAVGDGELMEIARAGDLVLELLRFPGSFVTEGASLVRVWPRERAGGEAADRIRETFIIGRRRTPTQDPEYALHQLVEIGVRALSPSVNDPFTAMTCLDWLGAALSKLAGRQIPSRYRYDERRRLRVIAKGTGFPEMADAAFNQIRQYGRRSVSVLLRLLDTIAAVAGQAHRGRDRACLRRHADKVLQDAREALGNESDLREVEERHAATLRALVETGEEGG